MRTREDFGPCELSDKMAFALRVWAGPGDNAWRRAAVAVAAMGNTNASEPESYRSMAQRVGVDKNTARAWAEDWMGWAKLCHAFDGHVLLGDLVRAAMADDPAQGRQLEAEAEAARPLWEVKPEPESWRRARNGLEPEPVFADPADEAFFDGDRDGHRDDDG